MFQKIMEDDELFTNAASYKLDKRAFINARLLAFFEVGILKLLYR